MTNTLSSLAESSPAFDHPEARAGIREALEELRVDVVSLGDRWEPASLFIGLVDNLISECGKPTFPIRELRRMANDCLRYQAAFQVFDEEAAR